MTARTSFVLMVLFIVLGSFALFDPLHTKEKEEEKTEREAHVVWLKDKKLESIAVKGDGKPTVLLECAKKAEGCDFDGTGDWILLQPEQDNADASAVGTLASTILNITHNEKVELSASPDPSEFGFDKSPAIVELRLKGQKEPVTLTFGKPSSVGPNVYMLASSDPKNVFLVPNYLPTMISKDVFHWRNKRIFPQISATDIISMEWKSLKAVRTNDSWILGSKAGNKIMLEGMASTLAYLSAKTISKDVPKKSPDLVLIFTAKSGQHKVQLYFKLPAKPKTPGETLAKIDGDTKIYSVDSGQFDRFQKTPMEYRRRTLLDDEAHRNADELRLNFPRNHQDVVLRKNGKEWSYMPASKLALSQARVNLFLDALRDSAYLKFGGAKETAAYNSQTPDLDLEVKAKGELLLKAKLTVFERHSALTESEGEVRTLPEAFLKALPVRLADLSEDSNQTVVVKPEKGDEDGHSH